MALPNLPALNPIDVSDTTVYKEIYVGTVGPFLVPEGSSFDTSNSQVTTRTDIISYIGIKKYLGQDGLETIANAVATLGSSKATVFIFEDTIVTGNVTIPETLEFIPEQGSLITISTGVNITWNSSTNRWPDCQVFSGSGTVTGLKKSKTSWFGDTGNGTTDDASAIQKAITASAKTIISFPHKTHKCNSGFSIDLNTKSLDINNCILDFSGMTSGNVFTITQSENDANYRVLLNTMNVITHGVIKGPGVAETDVYAIYLEDSSSPNTIAAVSFSYLSFINFANDAVLSSGAFMISFDTCSFSLLSGTATTYSISIPSGSTNAGERNTFRNCNWFNRKYVLNQANVNADTVFDNCSLDYGNGRLFTITGGVVRVINGSHIECSDDNDYWFHASGENIELSLNDVVLNITGNKSTYAPFFSDSSCVNKGVMISNCSVNTGANTVIVSLIAGTGRAIGRNISFLNAGNKLVISSYSNRLAYGDFESASFTGDWDLTGGTPPARSTTFANTGTYSLLFTGTASNTPLAIALIPCLPGEFLSGSFFYKVVDITGTSGTFYVIVEFVDKDENVLASSVIIARTTDLVTWTQQFLAPSVPAPIGVRFLKLSINIFGVSSGTALGYIDDVIINIQ